MTNQNATPDRMSIAAKTAVATLISIAKTNARAHPDNPRSPIAEIDIETYAAWTYEECVSFLRALRYTYDAESGEWRALPPIAPEQLEDELIRNQFALDAAKFQPWTDERIAAAAFDAMMEYLATKRPIQSIIRQLLMRVRDDVRPVERGELTEMYTLSDAASVAREAHTAILHREQETPGSSNGFFLAKSLNTWRRRYEQDRRDRIALQLHTERELATVLVVAIQRGVELGYNEADEDYKARYMELTGVEWVDYDEEGDPL